MNVAPSETTRTSAPPRDCRRDGRRTRKPSPPPPKKPTPEEVASAVRDLDEGLPPRRPTPLQELDGAIIELAVVWRAACALDDEEGEVAETISRIRDRLRLVHEALNAVEGVKRVYETPVFRDLLALSEQVELAVVVLKGQDPDATVTRALERTSGELVATIDDIGMLSLAES